MYPCIFGIFSQLLLSCHVPCHSPWISSRSRASSVVNSIISIVLSVPKDSILLHCYGCIWRRDWTLLWPTTIDIQGKLLTRRPRTTFLAHSWSTAKSVGNENCLLIYNTECSYSNPRPLRSLWEFARCVIISSNFLASFWYRCRLKSNYHHQDRAVTWCNISPI